MLLMRSCKLLVFLLLLFPTEFVSRGDTPLNIGIVRDEGWVGSLSIQKSEKISYSKGFVRIPPSKRISVAGLFAGIN